MSFNNGLLSSQCLDAFALLVPSFRVSKSDTKSLSPHYKADISNRLATSCSNKTDTGCM